MKPWGMHFIEGLLLTLLAVVAGLVFAWFVFDPLLRLVVCGIIGIGGVIGTLQWYLERRRKG